MSKEYHRRWRKRRAELAALADSSSEEDINEHSIQVLDNSEGTLTPEAASVEETHSDNEFIPDVLSFSESDWDDHRDSDSDESEPLEPDFSEKLASLVIEHKCTTSFVNSLLGILRDQGMPLPKDKRTLLGTPRKIEYKQMGDGQYVYFGIEASIKKCLSRCDSSIQEHDCIAILVNVDGVPLFKSSSVQLWPILCKFIHFDPFPVAVFCGKSKPGPVEDYLKDFLEEYITLRQNGIEHNGKKINVVIKAFICDAPARSYLKCTKGHTAYNSCERCLVTGTWEGRIVFNCCDPFNLRSDSDFRNFFYRNHQTSLSPLVEVGVSCIKDFSLDYMHLVCLGVVRRLLYFLFKGPLTCRLPVRQRTKISDQLEALSGCMPSEFARQPRSAGELDRWKATEFRQFLLYTGPIVLRNVLSTELYTHFLCLSVAMSILLDSCDARRHSYFQYAKELLHSFVSNCPRLYGSTFNVYNVHGLLHIADDVEHFECSLNEVSAFPFENYLQTLKKRVKNSHNPVVQVAKRIQEIERSTFFNKLKTSDVNCISNRLKDACFLLDNEEYAIVQDTKPQRMFTCDIIKQRHTTSFYTAPCDSKIMDVVYIPNMKDRISRRILHRRQLTRKAACLPCNEGHVIFPLLHGKEKH
jgi:hypothetical protein